MYTKDRVLLALQQTSGYLSGESMSEQLGVSRAAIWKAINSLREQGYEIDSVTNKGYRLLSVPDVLTQESVRNVLADTHIAAVYVLESVDSTNNEAKRQAQKGAPHNSVFVAEEQTGGKGRLGRVWKSPAGSGLWFTLLLRPLVPPEQVTCLTLLAGMAVSRAIRELSGLDAQIKWPNDVVLGGPKLCGILTEMAAEVERIEYVGVGIGVNVNTESFPEEIAFKATSLLLATGKRWNRAQLLKAILLEMETLLQRQENGEIEQILKEYQGECVTIGRKVSVQRGNIRLSGIAEGITDTGELLVRQSNGSILTINSGEVSVQGIYGE